LPAGFGGASRSVGLGRSFEAVVEYVKPPAPPPFRSRDACENHDSFEDVIFALQKALKTIRFAPPTMELTWMTIIAMIWAATKSVLTGGWVHCIIHGIMDAD
jgi:hypothetical protein